MTDKQAHSERAHARLSPSGAARFIACPGSIRLTDGLPDETSVFAAEGTAAHELGEYCVTQLDDPSLFQGRVINIDPDRENWLMPKGHKPGDNEFEITAEMVNAVRIYTEYAGWFREKGFELSIEERLDISHVVDGMFGTADLLAYKEGIKHLHVIDYKHGAGVAVDPEQNKQLMCYGLGALKRYGNRPVEKITLTIVQPRASHPRGSVRSWETTPERLKEFAGELSDAANRVEDPDAPLNPGSHCQFCRAAAVCPALREQSLELTRQDFDDAVANGVSSDELADWLNKVGHVETWCKKVREFANAEGREGRMPTGFKFVEKRATRKFRDEDKVVGVLRSVMELDDEVIYGPPSLQSVAKIEKAIGKKAMGPISRFVTQQSTGLVLVPDDDPRPAATHSAADEFDAQEID